MVSGFAIQDSAKDNGKWTRSVIAVAAAGSICVGDGMKAQNSPTATAPGTERRFRHQSPAGCNQRLNGRSRGWARSCAASGR